MRQRDAFEPTPFAFIGRKIWELRKRKRWTQEQLGQKLRRRKLSRQAIGWIESGKNTDLETIADIAATLGVDVSRLMANGLGSTAAVGVERPRDTSFMLGAEAAAPFGELSEVVADELIRKPRTVWATAIRSDPRYQTVGVVRRLVEVSETVIDSSPPDALAIADISRQIGDLLDPSQSVPGAVPKARAAAWRQYAFALFYVGEMARAAEAEQSARQALDGCTGAEYDLGRIAILRSIIASAQNRYDSAVRAAREAARVFSSFGDHRRLASALEAEAYALIHESNYRDAMAILVRLEEDFNSFLTPHQRATVTGNLGLCYSETGQIDEALQRLRLAERMHEKNGTVTEAVRTRGSIADLLVAQGRHAEAKIRFRSLQTEFEQLGMDRDAVLAGLGVAEILLLENHYAEAETLCRKAVQHFERTGLSHTANAMMALTYLTEAVAQGRATPDMVRHARRSIDRLRADPAPLFAPPPSNPDPEKP